MGYFNQKVLGIAMALLLLAFASCTSKPEGDISQTDQQKQESSMATQEQEEQESSTTAQSQEEEEEEGGTMVQSPEQPSTTPKEAAQVQEKSGDSSVITITGKVESGQDGTIISADDGPYVVTGQDLSEMAGKTVQATGTVKESEGLRTIEVTDVKVIE